MKKHLFGLLLAMFLAVGLLPTVAMAETVSNVQYRNYDAENGTWIATATCPSATVVTSSDTIWTGTAENPGWYIVNSDIEISDRVVVNGAVHLILKDGCTLTVNGGIQVQDDDNNINNGSSNELTIYAQSIPVLNTDGTIASNNTAGKLTVGTIDGTNAAIGGNGSRGGGGPGGEITVNGGIIKASGQNGAGIGGGSGGAEAGFSGGNITINGGAVKASSTNGAAIGGGYGGPGGAGGNITITGGYVSASTPYGGAGIGGGAGSSFSRGGNGGNFTITGGYVVADRIGYGSGQQGDGGNGTFKTNNGNAVIFAGSISDQRNKNNWSGVIFEWNSGKVYGTFITPTESFAITSGKSLLIPEGSALNISGISATNEGSVYVDGTLGGTITNNNGGAVYYPLTVNGCTASTTYTYGNKTYSKPGETITLTTNATPVEGEELIWTVTPEDMDISSGSFTMPSNAVSITASITYKSYHVSYNTDGGTFDNTPVDTYTFRTGVTLPTNIKKAGYTFMGWYDNAALTGNPVTAIGTTETGNKTFWAKWEANFYTVKFDTDGGSDIMYKTVQWENTVLMDVAAPTKTGWKFIEWKYNDTSVTTATTYSGLAGSETVSSITLKAQWQAIPPSIIEGTGQSLTAGEAKDLVFRSNAEYSIFDHVELDGAQLDTANYTVKSGSTIVTLKADYVRTLAAGVHTIAIVSQNGTASTTFTVHARPATPTQTQPSQPETHEPAAPSVSTPTAQIPRTADTSRPALWAALFLLSGGLLAVTVLKGKRFF